MTCFRRFGDGSYLLSPIKGLDAPLSASGGGKEREKVETILNELSPNIRNEYTSANTYHDGKRLAIAVDSDEAKADIKRRLTLKRKPKRTEQKSISEMESNEGT